MASKRISDLTPSMQAKVLKLFALCRDAGLKVTIIETKRTEEEHQRNVRNGVSWTRHSKHIDGEAIDLAITECLTKPKWAPEDPRWQQLGELGMSVGLKWGGCWKARDLVHFEDSGMPAPVREGTTREAA